MSHLELVIGPHPVFRQKAEPVAAVNADIVTKAHGMLDVLKREKGVGIGANMVGLLERIIVIDLPDSEISMPLFMVNPVIVEKSDTAQSYEEASLSFPGISAEIKRPAKITVEYLDLTGDTHSLAVTSFLATVIQHEIDYLDGVLFFDHLSKLKRDSLSRKYKKIQSRK